MRRYRHPADAIEVMVRLLVVTRSWRSADSVIGVLKAGHPCVAVGLEALLLACAESERKDGRPTDSLLVAVDRFELRPERVLQALGALHELPADEMLADAAGLDRCCRLLIDVQGLRPWELDQAGAMVTGYIADTPMQVRSSRLDEWLTWWRDYGRAIPDYLTWDYPAWTDQFATP